MSDIGQKTTWLVSPTKEIEDKWIEVQIQERISRINRYKQDIEDYKKGRILELEAKILMLELELKEIEQRRTSGARSDIIEAATN
jgi:hypothetical protein